MQIHLEKIEQDGNFFIQAWANDTFNNEKIDIVVRGQDIVDVLEKFVLSYRLNVQKDEVLMNDFFGAPV